MVKRMIAMLLGALAGGLLWAAVAWLRSPVEASADPIAVEHCLQDAFIDCVSNEMPAAAPEVPATPEPCKDWLSDDADIAALSSCLREARRERDAVRFENFKRAQRIAASS